MYDSLDEAIRSIGEVGHRLAQSGAACGGAGNISVYLKGEIRPDPGFNREEEYALPIAVPELAGGSLLVTGSGRRLGAIAGAPHVNLCLAHFRSGGRTVRLFTAAACRPLRPTVELNSHLAVHRSRACAEDLEIHAVVHAQPRFLVFLSHIPRYQNADFLSRQILCWQPESLVNFPQGIGYVPFLPPASPELMEATVEALGANALTVWAKHGVLARSSHSVEHACDLIDYAEAGAQFAFLNQALGGPAEGLSPEEIGRLCAAFQVVQTLFT